MRTPAFLWRLRSKTAAGLMHSRFSEINRFEMFGHSYSDTSIRPESTTTRTWAHGGQAGKLRAALVVLVVVDSGQRRIPPGLGIGIPVANWNSP